MASSTLDARVIERKLEKMNSSTSFEGEGEPEEDDQQMINNTSIFLAPSDMTYYVCGPLLTVFIIIGILGNAACLYVFLRRRPSAGRRGFRLVQPIYVYLLTLAAWDIILLITSFLLYNFNVIVESFFSNRSIVTHPIYLHSLPYVYYATITAHSCANWVVVALGLERYFALCHPFRHRLLDGRRRAIYVVGFISLAGILYSMPRLYETTVQTENEDRPEISFNQFQQTTLYKTLYKVVGGLFLYSVGPFVCLLTVSIRVSTAVRQQRVFQAEKTRRSTRTRRDTVSNNTSQKQAVRTVRSTSTESNDCSYAINVMLIAVMVKLLFVHSVPTALDVAEAYMGDQEFNTNKIVNYLVDASILLVVVNSSCNFFVYFVCSRQFRADVRRLAGSCCSCFSCGKKKETGGSSNSNSDQGGSRKGYEPIGAQASLSIDAYRKVTGTSMGEIYQKISMNSTQSV